MSLRYGSGIFITTSRPTILKLPHELLPGSTKRPSYSKNTRGSVIDMKSREVRILLFEHYRITYLIKPGGDIDIIGVFHGALDIDRYLI